MRFSELIQSERPTLVDFYADWCGPCKAMNPVVQELTRQIDGKAKVIKVNIDKNRDAVNHFGVRGVPTFMLFKNGEIVWQHIGGTSLNNLKDAIELHA
ncbi:MAG: thioredoxin [Bacteroidota bacterium]